jgi:hypothetical protein
MPLCLLLRMGFPWDSEGSSARRSSFLMRVISWLKRLTAPQRFLLGMGLFVVCVSAVALSADQPSVSLGRRLGRRSVPGPEPVPAARRASARLVLDGAPTGVYRRSKGTLAAADDAIQDDAPPIGLADSYGHSPALEPLGTLSAHHVIARGHAGASRPNPRGPPASS